ncbi:MAG: hypothetical protein RL398_1689 [Planctomycetota bacterium]
MIRTTLLLIALTTVAVAQTPTGRHYLRDSKMPVTAAQPQVVEASVGKNAVRPLAKLRSGRAWPKFHFGRLPQPVAEGGDVQVVEASARRSTMQRRGFWGTRR